MFKNKLKLAKALGAAALIISVLPAMAFADNTTANTGSNTGGSHGKIKARTYNGTVTAISGMTLSVNLNNGTAVSVDISAAKLVRKFGAVMMASDFQANDQVQIRGTLSGSALAASTVRDMSLQSRSGTFSGTITSLATNSFVLQTESRGSQTINVDSNTAYKMGGQAAQFSNLAQGLKVVVSGVWDRTNSNVTATKVTIVVKTGSFVGVLTAISGNALTVKLNDGTTATVDITNAKLIRHFGAAMQVADFQVNDQLTVTGTMLGTAITAKVVRDDSLQSRSGTFSGTITSVGTNSFVLQSKDRGAQTINIDSNTVFKKNGQPAQFSDLAANQTVTVSGVWDRTNSNVTAARVNIIIKMLRFNKIGTLSAISVSTLTFADSSGGSWTVDASSAKIVRKYFAQASLADLKANDSIQVVGKYQQGTTNVTATLVRDLSLLPLAPTPVVPTPTPTPTPTPSPTSGQ